MAKRFVLGDIHGNFKGLLQVFERSGFNASEDQLIFLGDVADGYSQVPECIEEFRKIKNFVWILGNHDQWVQDWYKGKYNMSTVPVTGDYSHPFIPADVHMWLSQGGKNTFAAYMKQPHLIGQHEKFWLEKPQLYLRLDTTGVTNDQAWGGKCFVHGGFNRGLTIEWAAKNTPQVLYWDRELWRKAMSAGKMKLKTEDDFDEIFIGHTSTNYWDSMEPMNEGGVWNIDTGAGWHGKVTLMNIDTKEYVQSDLATELYPNEKPRR
jgi:serine/threonine protein phosphatase 1